MRSWNPRHLNRAIPGGIFLGSHRRKIFGVNQQPAGVGHDVRRPDFRIEIINAARVGEEAASPLRIAFSAFGASITVDRVLLFSR
jgi:hypothetical protein